MHILLEVIIASLFVLSGGGLLVASQEVRKKYALPASLFALLLAAITLVPLIRNVDLEWPQVSLFIDKTQKINRRVPRWELDLQRALVARGYDVGEVDGVYGLKTKFAMISFQENNGLKSSAEPTLETMEALGFDYRKYMHR
ncbi:peptidoglycan-binding domain-containing protein [Thalassococcus lentus]|uniref:Peptidoglycan-binding domain-containing protein n=1 Tax=Thalassococcus lentus TaxID=1210524 RepID=A0ABT4XUH3_9RHOB|nr:peptidoglycan-binding domain-containing protein [Thalassococcus lentus]MDA7425606.1 peptidoglycan-binding domain-containing protein [Thalassococcus lentus]